jgi:hypothetical protein
MASDRFRAMNHSTLNDRNWPTPANGHPRQQTFR